MPLETKRSHKTGRILVCIALIYFMVLPAIIVWFFRPTHLWSPETFYEYTQTYYVWFATVHPWILVLFPFLIVILNYNQYISISLNALLLVISLSAVLSLIFKILLKKIKRFDIGYSWAFILFLILSILSSFLFNRFTYKYPATDWYSWSLDAASTNNPNLCLEKVESPLQEGYNQNLCLLNAASISGNVEFCYKTSDKDCFMQLKVISNFSKKVCDSDYSYQCVDDACANSADSSSCYEDLREGSFDSHIKILVKETSDTSLCEILADTSGIYEPDDCYASFFTDKAMKTSDPSWCDQISDDSIYKPTCYEYVNNADIN
ncbi:MAG: hypothetical protein WC882_03190 [Candidatus Gracilibacteria bacterium]